MQEEARKDEKRQESEKANLAESNDLVKHMDIKISENSAPQQKVLNEGKHCEGPNNVNEQME